MVRGVSRIVERWASARTSKSWFRMHGPEQTPLAFLARNGLFSNEGKIGPLGSLMPLSPRLVLLIVVAWLAGAGWYWQQEVVLRPTRSLRFEDSAHLLGVSPSGDAVVQRRAVGENETLSAPLELWSLSTG